MRYFFYIGLGAGAGLLYQQSQVYTDFTRQDPGQLLAQIERWTPSPASPIDQSRETRRKCVAEILETTSTPLRSDLP